MAARPGISVLAYARHRGVSHTAVQYRIAAGSLPTSAKKVRGRWVILDAALADAEWEDHTRARVISHATVGPAPLNGRPISALAEATLRERKARAWGMELELARKTRELVPAREVDQRWAAVIVSARTALLGIPTRAKGRLPHLTPADLVVLEALIREVLVELAEPGA